MNINLILRNVLLAVIYIAFGKLGLLAAIPTTGGNITLIWPPTGIAFAVALVFGKEIWPGLAVGAFMVNHISGAPIIFSVLTAIGNPLPAIVAVQIFSRYTSFNSSLCRLRDVYWFITIPVFLTTIISATIGVVGLSISGVITWMMYPNAWFHWWIGDAMGVLLLAPLLITAKGLQNEWRQKRRLVEVAGFIFFIVLTTHIFNITFFSDVQANDIFGKQLYFYIMLALSVLISLHLKQLGAVLAIFTISIITILDTVMGYGPPFSENLNESVFILHIFLTILAITSLIVAAAVKEIEMSEIKSRDMTVALTGTKEKLNINIQELENFAHSISHDLKAPLRAINGYSEILTEDYKVILDESGRSYLSEIEQGVLRMSTMIDGLLTHARLGKHEFSYHEVDLNNVVEIAKKNLSQDIREINTIINISDTLPVVIGHQSSLVMLFQNLLDNAVKFTAYEKRAEVNINVDELQNEFRIRIQDNGIGIDEKYRENIFNMFEHIHTQEEYSGNGIGLAIAEKIVRLHGGEIWLESEVGIGTTFFFSISKRNME